MNPFLEDFWPDFHTRLMVYLTDALQPQLPEELVARVEESLTVDVAGEDRLRGYRADLLVAHSWSDEPGREMAAGGVAVMEPDVYQVLETVTPRRVEIIDVAGGGEVITVIEVLSPSNKAEDRRRYREKCRLLRAAGVNVVEIDLLRGGEHVVAVPLREIPPHKQTPYFICASRKLELSCFNMWHIGLLQRLPPFAIPLRPSDRDAVVDLQPLIDLAYQAGRYSRRIDCRKPLNPPLPPEALAIVEEHLRAAS